MRIKLYLQTKKKSILPFNYEYAISAWIYKTLSKADSTFATWLHDKGYSLNNNHRKFKLFTFSKINPQSFKVIRQKGLLLEQRQAVLTLSFLIDKTMQNFVMGIFQSQKLEIIIRKGRIDFQITSVELLPEPVFKPIMKFRAIKPIFMSKREEGVVHPVYIAPGTNDYKNLIINNLIGKIESTGATYKATLSDFHALTPSKEKLFHIEQTQIKAFEFDFLIATPIPLMRIGYFAGFGGKNSSLGLGFCELIKN